MFRYVLLGMLRDGEVRHGYGLAKEYEQRTGVKVVAGNVYRELRKLVDEGLVERAKNSDGSDPRRLGEGENPRAREREAAAARWP